MHLFFSVGEPSGDEHAAELIGELGDRHPTATFTGFGGREMLAAGQDQSYPLADHAVMGVGQIVPMLRTYFRLADQAEAAFRGDDGPKPDACVLIDYPGFNWHIAKRAKKHGVPVVYYMPPQLWAWAPWRIRKARRSIDLALSGLPFEADWYQDRGVQTEHVSHPFFDKVERGTVDEEFVASLRRTWRPVAVLPGSRKSEVEKNFPVQVSIIRKLHVRDPHLRFHVACYKESQRDFCQSVLARDGRGLPVELHLGRTSEIIEASDVACLVSGSVSLELLARRTPAVVMYRGSFFMYCVGHTLITVPYFSLPNLIAGREVMPEHPFVRRCELHADRVAGQLHELLSDANALAAKRAELDRIAGSVVRPGGIAAAAAAIENLVGGDEGFVRAAA